jgi:hypothetical protein
VSKRSFTFGTHLAMPASVRRTGLQARSAKRNAPSSTSINA